MAFHALFLLLRFSICNSACFCVQDRKKKSAADLVELQSSVKVHQERLEEVIVVQIVNGFLDYCGSVCFRAISPLCFEFPSNGLH